MKGKKKTTEEKAPAPVVEVAQPVPVKESAEVSIIRDLVAIIKDHLPGRGYSAVIRAEKYLEKQ